MNDDTAILKGKSKLSNNKNDGNNDALAAHTAQRLVEIVSCMMK